MLPSFRILPPGTASVPPAPTGHAGLAVVLAAVMAAAMALAAVASVSVGGQAGIVRHGERALPPLAQGPVSAALDRRASVRRSFRRGRKAAGTVTVAAHAGANRVRFEGRISATNGAGQRAVGRTLHFRIVRG